MLPNFNTPSIKTLRTTVRECLAEGHNIAHFAERRYADYYYAGCSYTDHSGGLLRPTAPASELGTFLILKVLQIKLLFTDPELHCLVKLVDNVNIGH